MLRRSRCVLIFLLNTFPDPKTSVQTLSYRNTNVSIIFVTVPRQSLQYKYTTRLNYNYMLSNREQITQPYKHVHTLLTFTTESYIILLHQTGVPHSIAGFFVGQTTAGAAARNGESSQLNVTSKATRKPTPLCCTCSTCSLGNTYQGYSIDLSRLMYQVPESFPRKHIQSESRTRKTAATYLTTRYTTSKS